MHVLRNAVASRVGGSFPALAPGRFGWGAVQLSGASLLNRLLGFVYSTAVMRLAGPEAVGLFRLVWPVYSTAFTLATSGIPYAVAKLISERLGPDRGQGPAGREAGDDAQAALRFIRQGLALLVLTGMAAAAATWVTAPFLLGQLGSEPRAVPVLQLIVPSLAVAALASGCRAVFEGIRRMAVPAASLVVEQAVLSGAAIFLVVALQRLRASPGQVAAALGFASVLGEAAGLAVVALALDGLWRRLASRPPGRLSPLRRRVERRAPPVPRPRRPSWRPDEILALALPVAGGRLVASVGGSLNALILPNRLQLAGLTPSEAAAQIGLLRGVAMPMVLIPNIFSLALMTSLVPSISGAMARGRPDLARTYSDKAVAATLLFALPSTALMAAFADILTRLLYGEVEATPLLVIASAAAPFIYVGQTLVGVLRGLGRPQVPVQAHLAGLAVDTLVVFGLADLPAFGIRGAALASVAGYFTAWLVVQLDTLRRLGTRLRPQTFFLPLVGAAAGAAAGRLVASQILVVLADAGLPLLAADAVALVAGTALLAAVYLVLARSCGLWAWLLGRSAP